MNKLLLFKSERVEMVQFAVGALGVSCNPFRLFQYVRYR
jgi:hypothetical protein